MARHQQKGVAIITALLLAALAVTLVSGLFLRQQVELQTVENQRLHAQIEWLNMAALDWAGSSLFDPRRSDLSTDNLTQAWAKPVPDLKLGEYTGEVNARLSRTMEDAQGRFNLSNLLSNENRVDQDAQQIFKRLLGNLALSQDLALPIAQAFVPKTLGPQQAPFLYPEDLLTVPGVTPEFMKRLAPFVVILPTAGATATTLNVNTTSAEVLSAYIDGMSVANANALINMRKTAYFRTSLEFKEKAKAFSGVVSEQNLSSYSVRSDYFLVHHHIQLQRASRDTLSLLKRESNLVTTVWTRPEPLQ